MKNPYTNQHADFEYIPFPKLGSGSQFHTYDTHDGRVLKLPLTMEETEVAIAKRRHNINPLSVEEAASINVRVHTLLNGKARIPSMVNHPFHDAREFLAIFGNPAIVPTDTSLPEDTPKKQWSVGRVAYTQDKVVVTGDILHGFADLPSLDRGDLAKIRQLIDLYIQQTYKAWEHGYADYVLKIGDSGIDANGNFVLLDLGEYTSDPDFMLRAIKEKRWMHSIIPAKIDFPQIPRELHDYYQKTMDNAFSVKDFQAHWRKKHHCTACKPLSQDSIHAFIVAKAAEIDYVDRW
jgi:hypothetical protein